HGHEQARSTVNGRSTAGHARCLTEAREDGWLAGDTVGSNVPMPAVAYPQPVSPLGPVPRGTFLAYPEDTTDISQSGIPAKFPESTAPGTGGLEAFVLDAHTL